MKKILIHSHDTFGVGKMRRMLEPARHFVQTSERKAYRSPDFDHARLPLRQPVIFDRRNLFDPESTHQAGFEYFGIGRLPALPRPALVQVDER